MGAGGGKPLASASRAQLGHLGHPCCHLRAGHGVKAVGFGVLRRHGLGFELLQRGAVGGRASTCIRAAFTP